MDVFTWDHNFETGLPEVDRQHRQLVDIINRFGDLLAQGLLEAANLEAITTELFSYADNHFREEEQLMTSFTIDSRHQERHAREHHSFLREIRFIQENHAYDTTESAHSLLQFLNNWLAYHLLGSDKSLSRQIAAIEAGKSATSAFEEEEEELNKSTRTLLSALNNLFQQVSERNRQLFEMNRTLEEKVNDRTLALSAANRDLEELAMTDVLTDLPNRRHAMRRLDQLWHESRAAGHDLSCMMIDADGFKAINDQYGHTAGDVVLCALARRLRDAVRSDDIVCRLGGDEFLVICPVTPLIGAMHIADIVRKAVVGLRVSLAEGEWCGSISIGVASRLSSMKSPDDMIKIADDGVYAAKRAGRNCVRTTGLPEIQAVRSNPPR